MTEKLFLDDPTLAYQHFDQMMPHLTADGGVYDFGANVIPTFLGWVEFADMRRLYPNMPPITVVIPVTAHHGWIGVTVIWIAVVLTVYTGWQYYAEGKKVGLRAR